MQLKLGKVVCQMFVTESMKDYILRHHALNSTFRQFSFLSCECFFRYCDPYTLITRMQAIIDDLMRSAIPLKDSVNIENNSSGQEDAIDKSEGQTSAPSTSVIEISSMAAESQEGSSENTVSVLKAYDSVSVGTILFPNIKQVSSQGCSRVFIIKGLFFLV